MLAWIGQLLGLGQAVAEPIVGYFRDKIKLASEERQRKMEYKNAVHMKRLENVRLGKLNEAEWNLTSINNSSWKDEWLTLILSIPLVLVFFPSLVDDMLAGFQALEQTPLWYRASVGTMVASAFGYQKLTKFFYDRKYR